MEGREVKEIMGIFITNRPNNYCSWVVILMYPNYNKMSHKQPMYNVGPPKCLKNERDHPVKRI